MTVTAKQICQSISDTFEAGCSTISVFQVNDTLTEGIHDTPLLQTYWQSIEQDPTTSTERTTFRAGGRQTEFIIHGDLYGRTRGDLAEGIDVTLTCAEEMIAVLEAQDTKPYFGNEGVKAFHWRADRSVFEYGDNTQYAGARFTITVRVF